MRKDELSGLLYEFLEVMYLFQRREEGLFGASWQDIYLLRLLDSSPRGMSVGKVADNLRLALFSASRAVARLAAASLVSKACDPDNRRVIQVKISQAGRKLLAKVEDYQFRLITGNLAVMNEREIETLTASIGKLRALLAID